MRYNKFRILGCALLLLLLGVVANAQTTQPLYKEYRGVRLGMTAAEVRAKLGEPVVKSDDQDVFVLSTTETTQVAYDVAQRVVTISTDYTRGVGAPDYRTVVGEGTLLQRPDGSVFRHVQFDTERLWISYNRSAGVVPVVTVTLQKMK